MGLAGFFSTIGLTSFKPKTLAQSNIVPDNTLGAESSQIITNYLDFPVEAITGGATRRVNLFHSFYEFNISADRGAYFLVPNANIQNILARVTGNNPSEILGILGTDRTSNPNLYLMNPNGIIFGKNTQIDVTGSFVATTANAIQFPGGAEFSASSPKIPDNSLLSVNPTAFLFNQIINQGANSIENRGFLEVGGNNNLVLLGGNTAPTPESTGEIFMDGGTLQALEGRVKVGGLAAPGTVGLQVDGNDLRLIFPDGVTKANIFLNQSSIFTASINDGDSLVLNANDINLLDSNLFSGLIANSGNSATKSSDILIQASGIVNLATNSRIGNIALEPGDSGNINISAQSLTLTNGSSIAASANQGNSGKVNIQVKDTIFLSGRDSDGRPSGILSLTSPGNLPSNTKSQGINLEAKNILLTDDALIGANSFRTGGQAGVITIKATDTIKLNSSGISASTASQEKAGDISITTNFLQLENTSQISSITAASGNAGNINIVAADIRIIDDSFITTNAAYSRNTLIPTITSIGKAGNINIQTERINITNFGNISSSTGLPGQDATISIGNEGNININATEFIEIDAKGARDRITGLQARTFSNSRAGDITVNTKNLIIRGGAAILVEAANNLGGDAGNITINASDSVALISSDPNFFSFISTGVESFNENIIPVGNGGELTINTKNLQLINGSISSATFGKGNAGNINIISHDQVQIDGGVITSRVGAGAIGNGGDIKIQTRQINLINGGQIDSTVSQKSGDLPGGQGNGGNIRIDATEAVMISGIDTNGFKSAILTETQQGAFGQGGDITINTDYFRISDAAIISSATINSANAGNLSVNARVVEILNEGFLSTGTFDSGKAGDITISATDKVTIFADANFTNSNFLTGLSAGTDSSGDGGNIFIFTTDFNLSSTIYNSPFAPATVATRSLGQGTAGNINIVAQGNFNANNGLVNARSEQAGGGNIDIAASKITLRNNSDIRTDLSSGNARGGNIFVTADTIIALEDSDIIAFAPEGQGGNITFNTRTLFTNSLFRSTPTSSDRNSLQSLNNNGRSDINASGAISGNIIGVPDITFLQNSLTELQNNPIDTNALIANSCIARSPLQEGTFIITGTGGLPNRPGEAAASSYPTGDVQSVKNNSAVNSWKKGDPIVEAQGVYRLANGDLVMSRECR
ncbi:MAG: filamentous hemagglutinin N-terminal domain-containing protein [Goleter apudmare HA4340-LM2]|jgi:filamentous hemagglutinin family protein|nr:filamentous hemagglutinin N-terminal domain-containing protein [Goleter apudmare HA4340-LM2]